MTSWLKRQMPTPESVQRNRWLQGWLGPALQQPRLWHMSRKGIALGLAIGIFFGLLIPVAQIPFAAATAVLLRANLPMAIGSTLVTNPVTFAPVYYAAYRLGIKVTGQTASESSAEGSVHTSDTLPIPSSEADQPSPRISVQISHFWRFVTGVGKPLVVGLSIFAVVGGLAVYAVTSAVWVLRTRWRRRNRLKRKRHEKGPA